MYLVAELGNNHDGLFEKAKRLVKLAAESGADAAKFQIFRADKLVHPSVPSRVAGHKTQLERMRSLEFSQGQWEELYQLTLDEGLDFLATCFDVDTLHHWAPRLKYFKIASGDLTYHPLIRAASFYGRPVFISTGCATDHEIREAAALVPSDNLTLMHCVSKYPCLKPGLERIHTLREWGYRVGYSCHTPGIEACYAAACMGVEVIEKHFTDQAQTFGDHQHSATPQELYDLRGRLDRLKRMMHYEATTPDQSLQRGAYAAREITAGHVLAADDFVSLRPSVGYRNDPTGQKVRRAYQALEAISG